MKAVRSLYVFLTLLAILAVSTSSAAAQAGTPSPAASALGTAFTYQGKLTSGGEPVNGSYDFEFKLYNDPSAGSQVGSAFDVSNVTVNNGLFTAQLDFGNVFDGTALYLEIGVKPASSAGAYTPITPRRFLSATPYAQYAMQAGSVAWSGITGIPAGVTSGSTYQNVRVVAKSGGDYTTITDALKSINDASASNPYLIFVAPGVYTETVTMKPFVDIQGSGESTTKITSYNTDASTGTVTGASNAELRFLTVENAGSGDQYSVQVAFYNENTDSMRLTHVTLTTYSNVGNTLDGIASSNATNLTLSNVSINCLEAPNEPLTQYYINGIATNSDTLTLKDVSINIPTPQQDSDFSNASGIYVRGSSLTLTNSTIMISGAVHETYGLKIDASISTTLMGVMISLSGQANNSGVQSSDNSSLTIDHSVFNLTGYGNQGVHILNSHSSQRHLVNINSSVITANGQVDNVGLESDQDADITYLVNNSQITGSTNTILISGIAIARIGSSQLSGGPVTGDTVTCIGDYDENFSSTGYTTCP